MTNYLFKDMTLTHRVINGVRIEHVKQILLSETHSTSTIYLHIYDLFHFSMYACSLHLSKCLAAFFLVQLTAVYRHTAGMIRSFHISTGKCHISQYQRFSPVIIQYTNNSKRNGGCGRLALSRAIARSTFSFRVPLQCRSFMAMINGSKAEEVVKNVFYTQGFLNRTQIKKH